LATEQSRRIYSTGAL